MEEDIIPCGQSTPKRESPKELILEATYQKVTQHLKARTQIQEKLVAITAELNTDRQATEKYTAKHLRVTKNMPRPPGSVTLSKEFEEAWLAQLQRTGLQLSSIWRHKLSKQAKRFTERFNEKNSRATAELQALNDGGEGQRLLTQKLRASKERLDRKTADHKKRPHPYKRK